MSGIDWVPELAAALDERVPLEDGSRANWGDVVARVGRRRRLRLWQGRPRRGLRLAIVAAALFLFLAGAAAATYLLVRGNGGIAFGQNVELLVVNPNRPGLHVIVRCPVRRPACWVGSPAWSPDGTRLAFIRGHAGGMDKPSHLSVYVAAASGDGARRLTPCGGCGLANLGWSPDGKWIAFTREAKREGSLWIVPVAGGRPHRVTTCHAPCLDTQASWSPKGRRIVFMHNTPKPGTSGLYTVRPDGSDRTKIANAWGNPAWSPNGRRIAFDRLDGIAVANADGSDVHVVAGGVGGAGPGFSSWSPDGRKLVFLNTPRAPGRRGGYLVEVWIMNADGSGKERLYRSSCCVDYYARPIWSPDGRVIAFSADSAGGTFVINADGTGLRRLSTITSDDLSWQPLTRGQK